jgi:small subunit ribosomal protein S4
MHGWRRPRRGEYLRRLREKQKVKRYYGVLERTFRRYFRLATKRPGDTGKALLELLERRLDNVVYKLNWAPSRKAARQLITHGHIRVNGRKVDVPSYITKVGDRISVKNRESSIKRVRQQLDSNPGFVTQSWLQLDRANLEATVVGVPSRDDVQIPVEEQLIVEICSR